MGRDEGYGNQSEQRRCLAGAELRLGCQSLVHRASAGLAARVKLDLAEGALVVGNVLLQDGGQRLGLLRAQINSLEISDLNLIFSLLLHGPEDEKKIPDVNSHLNAVGIGFPVIGGIDDVEIRLCGNNHKAHSLTENAGRKKIRLQGSGDVHPWSQARFVWCREQDLNLHAFKALDPKSSASANSAIPA
jgi:hypothetical protein